ncbi:MAG: hypothetical protein QME57_04220 [Patescibacteria group bacterium]|nr:hypothetical protein [Patescibacteria group bacterium]
MNQKQKILIGILVIGIVLIGRWWIWDSQIFPEPQEVAVTTDKTEYEQGENVAITVFNGLPRNIMFYPGFELNSNFFVERENSKWDKIRIYWPRPYDLILIELNPGEKYAFGWDQKITGEDHPQRILAFPGRYRIGFTYKVNEQRRSVYSNEFMIKASEEVPTDSGVVNGLQFTIKSDKKVYEIGEPVKIEFKLKNVGEEGIHLYTSRLIAFIQLKIEPNSKRIEYWEREMPPVPPPKKEDFYFLQPQEAYLINIEDLQTGNVHYKIVESGMYNITAILRLHNNYYSGVYVDGKKIGLDAWTGTINSNTIIIEIK